MRMPKKIRNKSISLGLKVAKNRMEKDRKMREEIRALKKLVRKQSAEIKRLEREQSMNKTN